MFDKKRFSELLIKARADRTNEDYSKDAGVSRSYISNSINKKLEKPPTPEILRKLADRAFNGITYEELMEAAGYIRLTQVVAEGTDINAKYMYGTNLGETGSQYAGRTSRDRSSIPILGTIRAGLPLLAAENWDGQIEVPTDLKADFALRVTGDSMSWVGIYDGDLAILRQTSVAENGMIVAAGIEDGEWSATLKFYVKENGTPVLKAANPNYKDIPMNGHHRIIGQVISIQKEPPALFTYKHFLNTKGAFEDSWSKTIEKAISYGLDADALEKYIEVLNAVKKNNI